MRFSWFKGNKYKLSREGMWVLLLGLAIRLFACQYTYIINSDGPLYIHQARALYFGQWERLIDCGIGYLSNYPLLIAGAYALLHDWEVAAMAVSLLCSWLTLIPLYFIFKKFFDDRISILGTLIFALNPVLVGGSADVVKGPVCWFFMVIGLYFFIGQVDKRKRLYLLLSCLFFLMATWARVEACLFIIVSFFYIVFFESEKKVEKAIIFLTPVAVVAMICISGLVLFGISVNAFHRVNQIIGNLSGPIIQYETLRNDLTQLAGQYQDGVLKYFLPEARTNLWLVAFGTLLNRTLEAFFYPLFLIFAVGLGGTWVRIKKDRRILYISLLVTSGLILLYLHTVHTWTLYYRNMAIVIFPSFIFAGYGLERIVHYLRSRFRLRESTALAALCLMILASSLPKDLQTRAIDKHVFKEIGYTIAAKAGHSQEIKVATSLYTIKWLSFYANLDYLGAPCPQPYGDFKAVVGDSYEEFVRSLRKNGIKYFLWEEKHWPSKLYDFISVNRIDDFVELGRWSHPDTGMLILFEVVEPCSE